MDIKFCEECSQNCSKDFQCRALRELYKIYAEERTQEKREIIKALKDELQLLDAEPSEELQKLGEAVINRIPELSYIRDFDIKIGYVLSNEAKRDKGKTIYAECHKVKGPYKAYLPYDFIIIFYEPNIAIFTENQKKVLMWHELKHVGIGMRGLKLNEHDREDFDSIMDSLGIHWDDFGNDVVDILAGGEDAEARKQKAKAKKKRK